MPAIASTLSVRKVPPATPSVASFGRPIAPLPVENSWGKLLMLVPHALFRELRKLLYYLPLLLGVLIISLIPAINSVAPVLY